MDNKYRITVTDLETGARADHGGLPGQCDTNLGLICALGGQSDAGDAFFCAILSDNRGVSTLKLIHLADACFHSFSQMGEDSGKAKEVFTSVCLAFTKYVKNEIPDPKARELLYNGLAFFEYSEAKEK